MEPDQVLNQDCLPVLVNMPDQSVDVTICDPPYPNGAGLFKEQLIDGIAGLYLAAKKSKKYVIFFWTPVMPPPTPPPGWFPVSTRVWAKRDSKTPIAFENIFIWGREYRRQPFKVFDIPILEYRTLKDWTH